VVNVDETEQLILLKKLLGTNKQHIVSVKRSQFPAIPCSKYNLFVGGTVRQSPNFLSHSSFSKCQHLWKAIVAGIIPTDRGQQKTLDRQQASEESACFLLSFSCDD